MQIKSLFGKPENRRLLFPPRPNLYPVPLHFASVNRGAYAAAVVDHGFFGVSDGKKKPVQLWWQLVLPKAIASPKAVLIMFHGVTEHCDASIKAQAIEISERTGAAILLFDQYGHGRSDGTWVHIPSFKELIRINTTFINSFAKPYIKEKLPEAVGRLYAFGHSMGGGVVLSLAILNPDMFAGIVAIGPLIEMVGNVDSKMNNLVLNVLNAVVPRLAVLGSEGLSNYRDEAYGKIDREENKLAYFGKMRVGTIHTLFEVVDFLCDNRKSYTTPLLLVHGTRDTTTSHQASAAFVADIPAADKTLELLAEYTHLPLGPGQDYAYTDAAFKKVCDWLNARMFA